MSTPTATRWIKQLTSTRYQAIHPGLGPADELLRDCLGVYRGHFPPPRPTAPGTTTAGLGTSPIQRALSILTAESRAVARSLLRARTVAALVTGIRADEILVSEGIGAAEDGGGITDWRRDLRVRGGLFVPSWLDDAAHGRDLGPDFAPRSALRIGIDSLRDIGSILSWRTPPEWWRSDAAKNWLLDLSQLHWQQGLAVSVGGDRDPDLFDWLEEHPAPAPAERVIVEAVLEEELSDLDWWLDATDREPDFDAQHDWSYWVVGKRRVVRFVVTTPHRIVGYASMRVPEALPARFALRMMPEKRQLEEAGEETRLAIPFHGDESLSLELAFPVGERRVRGWDFPNVGKA